MAADDILNTQVWTARQTELYIGNTVSTVETSKTLYGNLTSPTAFSGSAKNVTVTPPEGAVEKVDLMGETSGFQNQEIEEKPFGMATITGTILLENEYQSDELLEEWVDTGAVGTSSASQWYRFRVGDGGRTQCAIVVKLSDGTHEAQFMLNNAYLTKIGDKKISGADGHWEMDFEATCLAENYYEGFKIQ